MDLEAANLTNARAGRITRAGMIACFAVAGAMLIASLGLAKTSSEPHVSSVTPQTLHD